jgi:hypothetical protein
MFNSIAVLAFTVNHEDQHEATNEELKAALIRRIKMIDANAEGDDGYYQTCGDELSDTSEGNGFFDILPDTNYYVVQSECGKYADGFYGWDGSIHDDEQIFESGDLPYKPNSPGIANILVGTGIKPTVEEVNQKLTL